MRRGEGGGGGGGGEREERKRYIPWFACSKITENMLEERKESFEYLGDGAVETFVFVWLQIVDI